ncbi:MAG: TraR/DksA family transcriptional regulator [Chthoniobacterales bacterium]
MASKKPAAHKAKPASSKPSAKKAKSAAKKPAAQKPAVKKKVVASKPSAKKVPVKAVKPAPAPKKAAAAKNHAVPVKKVDRVATKLTPFLEKQRERLLILKDTLLDNMNGVARDSLRSQTGGDASAFGMHQADAGSDAYDRDFALSLLSQEQDSLYEIDQALKRIEMGQYGVCEMSGKQIPKPRLEALPFTRYTVECQAEIEKRNRYTRHRQPVTSLFGLTDEESDGDEEDSGPADSKEKD